MNSEKPEKLVWMTHGMASDPMGNEEIEEAFSDSNIPHVFVLNEWENDEFEAVYQDAVYQYRLVNSEWEITRLFDLDRKRHEFDDLDRYFVRRLSSGWFDVIDETFGRETIRFLDERSAIYANDFEELCTILVNKIRLYGDVPLEQVLERGGRFDFELDKDDYTPLEGEWGGKGRPPYVNIREWIEGPFKDSIDIRQEFKDLYYLDGHPVESTVYIIDCEFKQPSLAEAVEMAEDRLGHVPDWLETAYNAERALYVGESGMLPRRIATHAFEEMADSPPPASLTRLTEVMAAGVVFRSRNSERGEELEEAYADDLSRASTEEVFVYSR